MGQSFCLFLPRLDGACFELFVREWRQAFPSGRWAVVLDNSGAHTSGHVRWPDGLAPVYLPPYSPEINPGERWFNELREPLSSRIPRSSGRPGSVAHPSAPPVLGAPPGAGAIDRIPLVAGGVESITTSSP